MTNKQLLEVLYTVKHNLDYIRPNVMQKVYVRNATANVLRCISELEDRIRGDKQE